MLKNVVLPSTNRATVNQLKSAFVSVVVLAICSCDAPKSLTSAKTGQANGTSPEQLSYQEHSGTREISSGSRSRGQEKLDLYLVAAQKGHATAQLYLARDFRAKPDPTRPSLSRVEAYAWMEVLQYRIRNSEIDRDHWVFSGSNTWERNMRSLHRNPMLTSDELAEACQLAVEYLEKYAPKRGSKGYHPMWP